MRTGEASEVPRPYGTQLANTQPLIRQSNGLPLTVCAADYNCAREERAHSGLWARVDDGRYGARTYAAGQRAVANL